MKPRAQIFVWVLFFTVVFWTALLVVHNQRRHDAAHSALKSILPGYADKVGKEVSGLKRETPSESVAELYEVNAFFSPGPTLEMVQGGVPLSASEDQFAIDAIMSNRRFLKVFSELSKMDKRVATQMVKMNLASSLTNYLDLYNSEIRNQAPNFKISTNATGPARSNLGFIIGFVPGAEVKKVVAGVRLKVLSLVWISGMLKLSDNLEQVEQVVRLAIQQRNDLYADATLDPNFKSEMLRMASVYNRQILSSALVELLIKDGERESNVMKKAGVEWKQRKLPAYVAAVTEFDTPVRTGALPPDYSAGSFNVKYVSPMSDTNFDILLQELHF